MRQAKVNKPTFMDGNYYIFEKAESQHKKNLYKDCINVCSIPQCDQMDLEIHHIQPISEGEEDTFINYIVLCHKCHRQSKIHKKWRDVEVKLLTYKFGKEIRKLNFCSDEFDDEEFQKKLREMKT